MGAARVDSKEEPIVDSQTSPRVTVQIFVADHCANCEYAYEVADEIRRAFPEVDLQIVNLSTTTEPIPDLVFATPTYLLNGRVWSLGNPSIKDVHTRLGQELQQSL
jgi:hypothetical protein